MEKQTSTPALTVVETAAVRLALFIRKYCMVHSRPACLFLAVYEGLNLASIALANESYPWYLGVNSVVWRGLKLIGQTVTFLHDDGTPDYILLISLVTTLSLFWLSVCYLMWTLSHLRDFEFKRVLNAQMKIKMQPIVTVVVLVCAMLHETLYIPYLDWLSQTRSIMPYNFFLQSAMGLTVISSFIYFSSYKLGSRAYSSMSTPYYALYGKGTYSLFVVFYSLFSYSEHIILHELAYIFCGGFWLSEVFLKFPFQQDLLTKIELAKGLLLLWTGCVLVLADINGLLGSSLLFLHIASFLALYTVVLTASQWYKSHISRKTEISFDFELELRLRWHLAKLMFDPTAKRMRKMNKEARKMLDTQEMDHLCKDAFNRFRERPYTLMCLIEYFFLLKEKIFVKVMLCQLQMMQKDGISFVDIACCEYSIMNALAATKSDQEAVQYYRFFQHIKRVKEEDEYLCFLMIRLSQLFESPLFHSSEMTIILSALISSINKTKQTYESLSQIIGDNPVFGSLYAGFLRLFHSSEKARAIEYRIKHMKHEMLAKYRAKEESVFFFDQLNLVLLVSLNYEAPGKVIISQGANLLGFQDSELIDSNCKMLIPEVFRHKHNPRYKNVFTYRHNHTLYTDVHTQLLSDKAGFCNIVHWKNRIINYDKGKLGAFVAVRLIEDREDFALVSGSRLVDMTANFHKSLAESGVRAAIEKRLSEVTVWKNGETIYRADKPPNIAIYKTKTVRVINSLEFKVVALSSKENALPSRTLSGKTVGFEVSSMSGTTLGEKEGMRILDKTNSDLPAIFAANVSRFHLRQKKLIRGLTLVSLCLIVVGIAGHVGMVVSIKSEMEDMKTDVVMIEEVSRLNTHMQLLALSARELSLPSSPFSHTPTSVLSSLSTLEQQLSNLTQVLISYSDSGIQEFNLPTVAWWTFTGKQISLSWKNAIDIASLLQASVGRILAAEMVDSDSVRELMRNAPAEARRCIQRIVTNRLRFHDTNFSSDRAILVVPVFISFYLSTVGLTLAAIFLLVVLGGTRKYVVMKLADLSTAAVINFHNSVGSRLEQVHGYEFPPIKVKAGRKLVYSMHKMQIVFWGVVLVGMGITVAAFQINYEMTYAAIQMTLYHQPFIFSLTSSIKTELAVVLLWLREAYLQSQSLFPFLPENNMSFSPSQQALSHLSSLLSSYEKLRGGEGSYTSDWEIQSDHFQFLYNHPENLTLPEMRLGYTPAILHLNYSVSACLSSLSPGEAFPQTCTSADNALLSLISLSDTNQAYFHDFADDLSSASETTAISILSLYSLAAVIYLVAVYAPVACKLVTTLGQEVDLYGLMTNITKPETFGTAKPSLSTVAKVSIQ